MSFGMLVDAVLQDLGTCSTCGCVQVSLALFFWIWLNVGVPLIGPVVTLALAVPAHGVTVMKPLIAESVGRRQLLWTANGLAASTIYEALIALCLVIRFACSVIVTVSLIKNHAGRIPRARMGSARSKRPGDARSAREAPAPLVLHELIALSAISAAISIALHTYTN